MADNPVYQSATLATLPVGTTPAADDVTITGMAGPALVQFVKLVDGTANGVSPIAGDAANGLDVDVTRLPALAAGTNNIGDVDVLTVPAPLSTTGGGTEATALRVTLASDSTGLVSVDDNGGSLTVDGTVTANAGTGTFATKEVRAATSAVTSVAGSATSVTLLASNANRLGATITNDSTVILRAKFGATASATSYTVRLVPDAYYEVPYGWTGVIDGIWDSAAGSARLTELTA